VGEYGDFIRTLQQNFCPCGGGNVPDRVKTEYGEFRTGRKVETFTRLRVACVVFKKK